MEKRIEDTRGYFRALAVDYDGTLTILGPPAGEVVSALKEVRAQGSATLLVSGRRLDDLLDAFPDAFSCFDVLVAENGGLLVGPLGARRLAQPVDDRLAQALRDRGVQVQRGEVLLACDGGDDQAVFEELRRLDLDCQLIRNRQALMVLPAGVTKASGVEAGLAELGISRHSSVAIGDAENDLAMLQHCELGVAVANAVPLLLDAADVVLPECDGAGVAAFLRGPFLSGKLRPPASRWRVQLGLASDVPVTLAGSRLNVLVTGASLSGKSFLAGLVAEQLLMLGYSMLVLDPEGDHARLGGLPGVLVLGAQGVLPPPDQVASLAARPTGGVVLDLSERSRDDAAQYIRQLPPLVGRQRAVRGLPHWVLVEEAQGQLSSGDTIADLLLPGARGCLFVTYRPDELAPAARDALDVALAVCGGEHSEEGRMAAIVAEVADVEPARVLHSMQTEPAGRALLARRDRPGEVTAFTIGRRLVKHVRHWHKYAAHEQPPNLHFLFRDADGHLTGAAAAHLAQLHDELVRCPAETIRHHVGRRDFSRWVRDVFRDPTLARAIEIIERDAVQREPPPAFVRQELVILIEKRYLR